MVVQRIRLYDKLITLQYSILFRKDIQLYILFSHYDIIYLKFANFFPLTYTHISVECFYLSIDLHKCYSLHMLDRIKKKKLLQFTNVRSDKKKKKNCIFMHYIFTSCNINTYAFYVNDFILFELC